MSVLRERLGWWLQGTTWKGTRIPLRYWVGAGLMDSWGEGAERLLRGVPVSTERNRIASLLREIGESVEIYYEPRNEGMEWYVGLADPHGFELPVHEHFADLIEGLLWLSRNGKQLLEGRA